MSLSRDQIIQTAIALADARGIEAVSIPFTLPVKEKTEAKASGKSELGEITLTITP